MLSLLALLALLSLLSLLAHAALGHADGGLGAGKGALRLIHAGLGAGLVLGARLRGGVGERLLGFAHGIASTLGHGAAILGLSAGDVAGDLAHAPALATATLTLLTLALLPIGLLALLALLSLLTLLAFLALLPLLALLTLLAALPLACGLGLGHLLAQLRELRPRVGLALG